MDIEQARANMVEQQIRTWGVLDQGVLELCETLAREDFIPRAYRSLAFADTTLPIGHGQQTGPPRFDARILQSIALRDDEKVLEIGTGCAWLTALMASQAGFVTSLDIYSEFVHAGRQKCAGNGLHNVNLEAADIFCWTSDELFDVIVITGSLPVLEKFWYEWLKPDGRLFAVVGDSPTMEAQLMHTNDGRPGAVESLFETELAPLLRKQGTTEFTF